MTTIFTNLRAINGVVSTDKTVMQNLETLCTASGCWLTYDVNIGKWSVIINDPTFAGVVKSFDNSNILGGINVSGTGINELYNKVSVEFPHKDLRDEFDYIDLKVPDEQRFQNELDNTLNMQFDVINDPIQASYLGTVELNQSRLDKIIEFRTDYTALGLKAGDIIEVTTDVYGYTDKLFRVVRMTEDDAQGGELTLSITALEYDDSIFDTGLLEREERTKYTSIIPAEINDEVQNSNITAAGNTSALGLLAPAGLAALLSLLNGMINGNGGSNWNTGVNNSALGYGFTYYPLAYEYYASNLTTGINSSDPLGLYRLTTPTVMSFQVVTSGVYRLDTYANFGADDGTESPSDFRSLQVTVRTGSTTGSGTLVPNSTVFTSNEGDSYDDLDVHKIFALTPGTYHVVIDYQVEAGNNMFMSTFVSGPIRGNVRVSSELV
jgi:hypothetical protein